MYLLEAYDEYGRQVITGEYSDLEELQSDKEYLLDADEGLTVLVTVDYTVEEGE